VFQQLARALEALIGPSLITISATLGHVALVALVAVMFLALARAAYSLIARHYGWERAWIVRCPECGRLAADPREPVCPSGHKLRFPPAAARAAVWRGHRATASAVYLVVLSIAAAAAAFFTYTWLRVGSLVSPLSRLCAGLAFLFFLASLYAGDFALSPRPRGVGARTLHAGLALACLTPFLLLTLLSRAFEPLEQKVEATLWATPSGVYISVGRARKIAPSASSIEARSVEARLPEMGLEWNGLAGFKIGETEVPWDGRGGSLARWLGLHADALRARGVVVRRLSEVVSLPFNVRVRVLSTAEGFRFEPEAPP
jgi:hypothetical protein